MSIKTISGHSVTEDCNIASRDSLALVLVPILVNVDRSLDTVMLAALHVTAVNARIAVACQLFKGRILDAVCPAILLGVAGTLMNMDYIVTRVIRAEGDRWEDGCSDNENISLQSFGAPWAKSPLNRETELPQS